MPRATYSARKAVSSQSRAGRGPAKEPAAAPERSLSVRTPVISQQEKPKRTRSVGNQNVLKEIRYYQKNVGFLIPKMGVVKLIRHVTADILKGVPVEGFRFTSNSLGILHEALENHLVCLLEMSYMAARHAKRVTLFPSDIRLINRIKRNV